MDRFSCGPLLPAAARHKKHSSHVIINILKQRNLSIPPHQTRETCNTQKSNNRDVITGLGQIAPQMTPSGRTWRGAWRNSLSSIKRNTNSQNLRDQLNRQQVGDTSVRVVKKIGLVQLKRTAAFSRLLQSKAVFSHSINTHIVTRTDAIICNVRRWAYSINDITLMVGWGGVGVVWSFFWFVSFSGSTSTC